MESTGEVQERQRRWRLVLEAFEAHGAESKPWMSAISSNDPDRITEITNLVRERVSLYSWYSRGNWFCISDGKVSQSRDGVYSFIEFGKGQLAEVEQGPDEISIGHLTFKVPPSLATIYADLIRQLEAEHFR